MNTPKTKLDELYSLREDFSIIGITGRTGSGCSKVAELLSKEFDGLEELIKPEKLPTSIQERKYEIVYNFNKFNWKQYKVIHYKNILLLMLVQKVTYRKFRKHLLMYYRKSFSVNANVENIKELHKVLFLTFKKYDNLLDQIRSLGNIGKLRNRPKLNKLNKLYWGEFIHFANEIDSTLRDYGKIERVFLLHHTASNFRKSGQPYYVEENKFNCIYHIAEVINRVIKATRLGDKEKKCHIVIDSLRNSSEINFFKERFSGFYLVAVKSEDRRERLKEAYNDMNLIEDLLKFDEIEYKCNDFVKGHFFSPDVQNCIQKADYHIITAKNIDYKKDFISLDQQLIKLQGLIQQPGLITPSPVERCMQFAFNAKLSSGCISRQVGAVITDKEFSVKAIGWNDVPRGAVPCSVRNVKELGENENFGFSDFEKGNVRLQNITNSDNPDLKEIDIESNDFKQFVLENFNEGTLKESDLGGINCPYCFKTAYNKFKGDSNQVHTRSLHAEENAMLQISKYGGQPLKNGILFTTASPCELCSKKAYQLGITEVFYIDPYPGISKSHILKQGIPTKSEGSEIEIQLDPKLKMFYGGIGRGYVKLYEPFMAQKDEISILTNLKVESPKEVKYKFIKDNIEDNISVREKLEGLLEGSGDKFERLIEILKDGLNGEK